MPSDENCPHYECYVLTVNNSLVLIVVVGGFYHGELSDILTII
jgi:hypothetical protein